MFAWWHICCKHQLCVEAELDDNLLGCFAEQEPLEPYERYTIILHTRPNKETCNLKRVNDSERTYGSTQVYFMQGSKSKAIYASSKFGRTRTGPWPGLVNDDRLVWPLHHVLLPKLPLELLQTSSATMWQPTQQCWSGRPSRRKTPEVSFWVIPSTTWSTATEKQRQVRFIHHLPVLSRRPGPQGVFQLNSSWWIVGKQAGRRPGPAQTRIV